MKTKLFFSLVLICSLFLSVKSFNSSNNSSKLLADKTEALSYILDEVVIECGRYEGCCWDELYLWNEEEDMWCPYCEIFTGYTDDICWNMYDYPADYVSDK